ncbi:MAG: hypothetical protein PF693_13405 [Spirochaetia bacterium]|jgi:hypothetical protein|nr:hypothetical protein [Spirochaetia bacterium]
MDEIRVPEEEILTIMKLSLAKELPEILENLNDEKQTEWLLPFETISTDISRIDNDRKPAAYLSIKKTIKKIEDAFIEKGEYNLEIHTLFEEEREHERGFRYGAILYRLLKTSTLIPAVADRVVLSQMEYIKNRNNINGKYSEAIFKIQIIREGF